MHAAERQSLVVAVCPEGWVTPTAGPFSSSSALSHPSPLVFFIAPVIKTPRFLSACELQSIERPAVLRKALRKAQGNGNFFHHRTPVETGLKLAKGLPFEKQSVLQLEGDYCGVRLHLAGWGVQDASGSGNLLTRSVLKNILRWFTCISIHISWNILLC